MSAAASSKLRIGYVLKRYPRYSETFIVNEILALEARGVEVEIFALRPATEGHFHANLARVKAPVHYLPAVGQKSRALMEVLARVHTEFPAALAFLGHYLSLDVAELEAGLHVALLAKANGVTLLHAHFASMATAVARAAAAVAGIPYTLTAHAKDIFHNDVDATVLQQKLYDAAAVVTVSDYNIRHLLATFPQLQQLHRIYNGMDLNSLEFGRTAAAGNTILTVGRLVEKKGFAVLLQAMALLQEVMPELRCHIVGDGPLAEPLHRLTVELGLQPVVQFHGVLPQHEVHAMMRRASAFVAPCVVSADGDRDGLPTVLLEAMALGLPCIATPVTGIPEVLRHQQTGLLVPERDAQAIADACRILLDQGQRAQTLAVQARRSIEENFDVSKAALALQELWQSIVARSQVTAATEATA